MRMKKNEENKDTDLDSADLLDLFDYDDEM